MIIQSAVECKYSRSCFHRKCRYRLQRHSLVDAKLRCCAQWPPIRRANSPLIILGCASGLTDPDPRAGKGSLMGLQLELMIHSRPQNLRISRKRVNTYAEQQSQCHPLIYSSASALSTRRLPGLTVFFPSK